MQTLIAAAGVLTVGAITPGPNNLIVMRQTARAGWKSALPAATGIVAGGLALLMAVSAGASALVTVDPRMTLAMSAGSCLLLAGIGTSLILGSSRQGSHSEDVARAPALASFGGLFVFQFLNPKAWLLVVATVSSAGSTANISAILPPLIVLFVSIPAICLAFWCFLGSLATRQLTRRGVRTWFDRLTGVLLVGFALLLLLGGLDAA